MESERKEKETLERKIENGGNDRKKGKSVRDI
jgi:hypothetical protein